MNRHMNLPPTQEGAKLNLSQDEIDSFKLVYEKTDENNTYTFKCDYTPEVDYGDNCIIAPLTSVFVGTEVWNIGEEFANILGSSGDSNHPKWHALATSNGVTWAYLEEDYIYDCNPKKQILSPAHGFVVGGHVVKGRTPVALAAGSNFYIVPISAYHNSMCINHNGTTPGNGNGFYMKLKNVPNRTVLKLTAYLQLSPDGNTVIYPSDF